MTAPLPSPHPPHHAGQRLAKRVAEMLPCSRREAELYITGGWVRVDGEVVEAPQFRLDAQRVELDKNARLMAPTPVTFLLHKPPGYDDGSDPGAAKPPLRSARQLLDAAHRSADDTSGITLLKRHLSALTAPVPLESGAGGLLVFTQDWRIARKLMQDAGEIEHEIIVEIEGHASPEALTQLNQGLRANGRPLPRIKVSLNSATDGRSKLRFAVKGSHPGLLAHLCERLGLRIRSMKRIRIGRVMLKTLPPGQWRLLQAHERF